MRVIFTLFSIFLKLLYTLPPYVSLFFVPNGFNFFNSSPLPPTLRYKTYTRFVTTAAPFNNINNSDKIKILGRKKTAISPHDAKLILNLKQTTKKFKF